jgi:hypothetical protein
VKLPPGGGVETSSISPGGGVNTSSTITVTGSGRMGVASATLGTSDNDANVKRRGEYSLLATGRVSQRPKNFTENGLLEALYGKIF